MAAKQPLLKVYIDVPEFKVKTECDHCRQHQQPGAYLRFFRINPETEIYKCEKKTCMFPFKGFIYRDTPTQKLYRIGTNPVAERNTYAELSADLDSYINKYNQEGIPDTSDVRDIIEDLFPVSDNETTPSNVEIDLPGSSSPIKVPYTSCNPTKFIRVNLVTSLLQNLEGNYKCKSCESKCLLKYLKFHQINDTTELFKCESSSCMFPFRNFIYRDRRDQSYFRCKPTPSTESSTTILSPQFSMPFERKPPEPIPELEYDMFDGSSIPEEPTPQPDLKPPPSAPKIIEQIVISPRYSPGKFFSIKKRKKKGSIPSEEIVRMKKIPTPLELIRNLLKRKEPIDESLALESQMKFKPIEIKQNSRLKSSYHQRKKRVVIKTGVFPAPTQLPQLDENDQSTGEIQKDILPTPEEDVTESKIVGGPDKETPIECSTTPTKVRKSGRVRRDTPQKLETPIPEVFKPSKPRTRSMTMKSIETEKSSLIPPPPTEKEVILEPTPSDKTENKVTEIEKDAQKPPHPRSQRKRTKSKILETESIQTEEPVKKRTRKPR